MRLVPYIIAILVVIALTICALLLFVPSSLPDHLQGDTSNRIALAQLSVEAASVFALLLAAWEFYQAQRAPQLRLFVQSLSDADEPIGSPGHLISITRRPQARVGDSHAFRFRLLLDNFGNAPARWIKITMRVDSSHPGYAFQRLTNELPSGQWIPDKIYSHSEWYAFHGGDDYIAYNRPKKVVSFEQWLEPLGHFSLHVPVTSDSVEVSTATQIICTIQADGFAKFDQALLFRVD